MELTPDRKAVVYPTTEAYRFGQVPGAEPINAHAVKVPLTVPAMSAVARAGLGAVPPILVDYDWPCRYPKPYRHQKIVAGFLTLWHRNLNACGIGTGKTLSTLWALDHLMRTGQVKRALIMTPLSTIWSVWYDELYRHFLSRRKAIVVYGDRAKRLELLREPADLYLMNHDGLAVGTKKTPTKFLIGPVAQAVKDRTDIDCIVVDEASEFRHSGTTRYRVLRNVAADKPRLWLISGTPVPNEPTDAWGLGRLMGSEGCMESFVSFRDRTMQKLTNFKWVPRRGAMDIAYKALNPAIRFSREECMDLPECVTVTRDVPLSPDQIKAMTALKRELAFATASGEQITAVNEAALRTKFIQICCGAVYDAGHNVHLVDASGRLAVLKELIEQASAKVIVFAPLTSVVDFLHSELNKFTTAERINGAVSAKERARIIGDFQSQANPRVIVADPGAMAHGVTLTAASVTVWYGPTDKPGDYEQAIGRMNRGGQTRKMLVVNLVATETEKEIYLRLASKQRLQGALLKMMERKP